MALNVPTVTRDDISFGPARLFLGLAAATPTTDVGAISEDGVSVEITSEQRDITQGNPKIIELTFTQAQSVMVKVTSIEWNHDSLAFVLGGGVTAVTVTKETFAFGGDPCPTELALRVQHQMCISGDTILVDVWRAVGDGATSLSFTHDEHEHEYNFKGLRAATEWSGLTLPSDEQLFRITRQL